jgi:predicted TIM-barrel fold metal-dependent hydrolase
MLSRRRLLAGTFSAGAGLALVAPPLAQSTAQTPATQGARKRMIVDAQVHLWQAETPDRPWVPGRVAQMPEPFTIEKLVPLMNEAGIDRVVIVPPSWPGDYNDYALQAAKRYPDRFAVMGRIPLKDPKSVELLPKWRQQPGMLGVRLTFNRETAAWLADGTADWFWPAAEKAGLPVMFLAPGNMPRFMQIAERHPQLTLIIDHMAISVDLAKERKLTEAITQTVALAKYPNVSIKLSSAPTYSLESYPFRDMTERLRRCFEAFGPQRCYWGTDMTNSFAKATYKQRITHFTEELPFLTEQDKDWIMGRGILARLRWS